MYVCVCARTVFSTNLTLKFQKGIYKKGTLFQYITHVHFYKIM